MKMKLLKKLNKIQIQAVPDREKEIRRLTAITEKEKEIVMKSQVIERQAENKNMNVINAITTTEKNDYQ